MVSADSPTAMANLAAIRSVSSSLADYLTNAYSQAQFPAGVAKPTCTFSVVSSSQVQDTTNPANQSVSVLILLYRADVDTHLRNSGRLNNREMNTTPLSVDLQYLITFWSTSADNEQLVLAWTMRQLHQTPLLDSSILSAEAGWVPEDNVYIIPAELNNEDMMRIWDSLRPDFRLSLAYTARVVRIDPEQISTAGPVVATRLDYAVPDSSQ